jgi:hypothetical protein
VQSREWTFCDKSDWGNGPWQSEPDKMQWQDQQTGYPCLIVRGPSGALCGYVGVSTEHPLYEKSLKDAGDIDVHGGLTFADRCAPEEKEHGVCHITEPGEPDNVWWFGFDCAHAFDLAPKHEAFAKSMGMRRSPDRSPDIYRALPYVMAEVGYLAKQLAELSRESPDTPEPEQPALSPAPEPQKH